AVLQRVLAADVVVPASIRVRWDSWLATAPPRLALGEALRQLEWSEPDLSGMCVALVALLGEPEGLQALLLDPNLAPQAMALRLPDGRQALNRLVDVLRERLARSDETLRVAVLDARAGQMFTAALSMLDDPR